ncbi:hypothetical protein [Methylobacterium nodulans]|uniref:GtrA family protein n=1 Tax=Methylobacterium nodulans (strain LMG 21967 / CNCM I-2342 / ORS 2060) TaxID=460265 RepID=B8IB24_METNO|nr:hypothetical protein [Methylobacterium nodulans]ACL55417.1 conserved hypothetical protein [Methylobacterium nodulans ORS 2060]
MPSTALLAAGPSPAPRSLFESRPVLWGLVALGLAGAFGLSHMLPVLRDLVLPDTDDAMRLVQVRDLLAGQSWFDVGQHRLLPPGGSSMHWSRLVDLPIAALILILRPFAGAQADAVAAALWPPLLFGLYSAMLFVGARRLSGERAALLALFAATQTPLLTSLFAPGRIDHHNVQVCAVLGLALCLMRPAPGWREGAAAGALAALSLAVGLETLPFIAAAGLLVTGAWILSGERALGAFLGFAAALAAGSAALFGLGTTPAHWGAPACDALSPPWLWVAGSAGATALAAAGLRRRLLRPETRLALAALGGLAIAGGFAAIAPACLDGPFAGMPETIRQGWLLKVREMLPLWRNLPEFPGEILSAFMPLLVGALAATVLALRGPAAQRRPQGILAAALWLGVGLGTLQFRGLYVASGFVALAAGAVLDRGLAMLRTPGAGHAARAATLAAGLGLIGKLWLAGAAVPSLPSPTKPQAGNGESTWSHCTGRSAMAALAAQPPGTVLAPIDLGPFLLLHTPHGVVAAPYHRNTVGLAAALEGFRDAAALRRVAAERQVAYIAVCPPSEGADGGAPLIGDLARRKVAPSWLEPIPMPDSPLKIWRVRPQP